MALSGAVAQSAGRQEIQGRNDPGEACSSGRLQPRPDPVAAAVRAAPAASAPQSLTVSVGMALLMPAATMKRTRNGSCFQRGASSSTPVKICHAWPSQPMTPP